MTQFHPFHMVFTSPWPLLMGLSTLNMFMGTSFWLTTKNIMPMNLSLLTTIIISYQWWRDISRESSMQGFHSNYVIYMLRWGMILFITSEILFFLSFFWSFFHSSLAPNMEMGNVWPPMGMSAINPFQVPLLNTAILLASGITVTWSHHALIDKNNSSAKLALKVTILLGFYFTCLQAWEYWDSSFSLSDGSYGAVFFVATGFHGLHVLIGSLFLFFSYLRMKMNIYSKIHHVGYESAIWYWHFVDVVWLFLFCFIYWWAFYNVNMISMFNFQLKSNNYIMMFVTITIMSLICLLFLISFWLKTDNKEKEKKSIFECGFDPSHEKRNSFSLRFFMMTIIFLLFDLEVTFILPLPLQSKALMSSSMSMLHLFVITFFSASTYLEWKQGALAWVWMDI